MKFKQKLIASAIAFVLAVQINFAQTVLQSNLRSDFLVHSTALTDSDTLENIYLAGRRYQPSFQGTTHPSNMFIVKYDPNNNIEWSIETNYTDDNQYNTQLEAMVVNDAGEVFIGGVFRGDDLTIGNITYTAQGSNLYEIFLAKISTTGIVQWIKGPDVIHDPDFNHNSIGSLTLHPNGNIFLTGAHRRDLTFGSITLAGDPNSNLFDKMPRMFYGEMDVDGNFIWMKNTIEILTDTIWSASHFPDLSISPQGNIWMIKGLNYGSVFGQDTVFSPTSAAASDNYAVVKLNPQGEYINHAIIESEIQYARAIHADVCDNAVVLGVYRDSVKINGVATHGSPLFNTFLYRLDSDMNVMFNKNYETSDMTNGQQVVTNEYNEIFLTIENSMSLPEPMTSTPTGLDITVIKLDSTGNYLWHQVVEAVDTGILRARDLRLNYRGHVLLAGNMHGTAAIGSQNYSSTQGHAFFALISDDGIPTGPKPCELIVGINDFQTSSSGPDIYPNPTSDNIHIAFTDDVHAVTEVQILNTMGQVVLSAKTQSGTGFLDTSRLPAGTYIVRFPNDQYPPKRFIKL